MIYGKIPETKENETKNKLQSNAEQSSNNEEVVYF